jgi:phosphatidylserine/phosphatidylglycerophosphate/cardiolipin synthase-like enzyme
MESYEYFVELSSKGMHLWRNRGGFRARPVSVRMRPGVRAQCGKMIWFAAAHVAATSAARMPPMTMLSPLHATDDAAHAAPTPRRGRRTRWLLLALASAWVVTGAYNVWKPMPPGTRIASPTFNLAEADVRFLYDLTVGDGPGQRRIEQQIFDAVFAIIDSARDFVVLDFFLINDDRGALGTKVTPHRPLSFELIEHLRARKQAVPELRVLLVTDPINDAYGGAPADGLDRLRDAGIDVAVTRLDALRDSNPLYSGFYRLFIGWWAGDGNGYGWLPNPLDDGPERVTLRSWLSLLNFKANHRKVIAADDGAGGLVAIVTSGNPHDASSAHSNVALMVRGPIVNEILDSELAIARFSGWNAAWSPPITSTAATAGGVEVQYLTEGAIADATLAAIDGAVAGDAIDIAMFYLSERRHVEALAAAAKRGVEVRILLDPNKDAFGHTKDGVPNRPVAVELLRLSGERAQVRWYRTHGEQFHVKFLAVRGRDKLWLTLGSTNLTRRNIADYNLEANIAVTAPAHGRLSQEVLRWFDTLWRNDAGGGPEYTADFSAYADRSRFRYWRYRVMEATGLSTF